MTVVARAETSLGLAPWSLKDAPSFIERQFPVGRLSAEAYKERKAGAGQTLTALGSYWKGRKPLILVRAVVLGCLLPATDDAAADLDIFLKLMAMDDGAFGRRFNDGPTAFVRLFPRFAETVATTVARAWRADIPAEELKRRVILIQSDSGGATFAEHRILDELAASVESTRAEKPSASAADFARRFPRFADELTVEVETSWRWRDDLAEYDRQVRIAEAFASLPYADRLKHVRRPEECDEADLLAPIWRDVNHHFETTAWSLPDFVEQLGVARFGHRPKVADTFCGGGSIPFEAARIGCDVYASDLSPIACMLTWGAFNIIGAAKEKRAEIERAQKEIAAAVDAEVTRLGIEHDTKGNRSKVYLYCLETQCPKTGWMVPLAPSWVISKTRNVVAKLVPDQAAKCYAIEIHSGVSPREMTEAEFGTVRDGRLVHPMNPERSGVEIKTIRGDYRDADGNNQNRLRLWEKADFVPQPEDIFQERLYCIQWITKSSLSKGRQVIFFAAVTEGDLARERKVEAIVRENLGRWQEQGLVPDMPIKPGEETTRLFRERGWTHWLHLFNARNILGLEILWEKIRFGTAQTPILTLPVALDNASRLCGWNKGHPGSGEFATNVLIIRHLTLTLITHADLLRTSRKLSA